MRIRRVRALICALLLGLAAAIGVSTPAHATIYWYNVTMHNLNNQGLCATADTLNETVSMTDCHNLPTQHWDFISSAPDAGGHAYVEIRPSGFSLCLTTLGAGTGPSQIANSSAVILEPCYAGSRQIWAMATAYPPQVYEHYITFFSFGDYDCLDGGIGLYGFNENGCNPNNSYQVWGIIPG